MNTPPRALMTEVAELINYHGVSVNRMIELTGIARETIIEWAYKYRRCLPTWPRSPNPDPLSLASFCIPPHILEAVGRT